MTLFFLKQRTYMLLMMQKEEGATPQALHNESNGPWDLPGSGDNGKAGTGKPAKPTMSDGDDVAKPANPWEPQSTSSGRSRGPSLEEMFRRGGGKGGGFGGLPPRANGKSWWPIVAGGLLAIWVLWTSIHRLDQQEEGVVTFFGKYSRTVGSGISFTLPAPIEQMQKVDALQVRTTSIGSASSKSENLVLTKDQNLMDIAFDIRWSIKSPELYLFQLDDPDVTVQEIGESAMRAELANFDYNEAVGIARGTIEAQVKQRMQAILDEYRSGIAISSISIRQSDPPEEVKAAFREVNSAQQRRERYLNEARAYASQVTELAAGQTAEFDKIYEQYRQSPEVTRRRIYYETMEQVLSKADKTIVESGNVTPYLPLPELKRRANAASESSVTVSGKQ
jgi:modulator of FtsH protease HflK